MASKHQTKLIKEYESRGYFVLKLIRTNKNAIPDLLCLRYGEPPIFIESKEASDIVSELQLYMIGELNRLGFKAFVSQAEK